MLNMKRVLCALPFFISSAYAADPVSAGMVHFTGEILSDTCTVETTDLDMTVPLPPVSADSLNAEGKVAGSKIFKIHVKSCPAGINGVTAHFEGVGNTKGFDSATNNLTNVFKEDTSYTPAHEPAEHVQIRLFDKGGQTQIGMASNDAAFVTPSATNHDATLEYEAAYYATAAVTAGYVKADVAYTLIYQ